MRRIGESYMSRQDAEYFEPPRRQDAKNILCRQQVWCSVHGWAFTPLDAGSLKTLKWNFLAPWRFNKRISRRPWRLGGSE